MDKPIQKLWNSDIEKAWRDSLQHYYDLLTTDEMIQVEDEIKNIKAEDVEKLSTEEFYGFLHNKFYIWQFPSKKRQGTTIPQLERYKTENRMDELAEIKESLFSIEHSDINSCLETAKKLRGLGVIGASGLLAVLFPKDFGTVSAPLIESLKELNIAEYSEVLQNIKPQSPSKKEAVILINIMRDKAEELNKKFNTDFWTPRKIDMILWSFGRTK